MRKILIDLMLKRSLLLLLLFGGQQYCFAQFGRAKLQATGLTCALCSKAIHQAIEKLPFVQQVSAQLAESAFEIVMKPGASADPAQIRTAVEEAGFFIGALYLTREEASPLLGLQTPHKEGSSYFSVVQLAGAREGTTYQVIQEHFLTEKAFAKVSKGTLGAVLRQQPTAIEGAPVFYLKSL